MTEGPEAPFNPKAALAELAEGTQQRTGRKLSFPQKCAAYCALTMTSIHPSFVAKAFGVTATTISLLKNAGRGRDSEHTAYRGNPDHRSRYGEILAEFNRLGHDAFRDRYYTDDVHTLLMNIKHRAEAAGYNRQPQGPNPNADKFAFKNYGAFQCQGQWWRVDLTRGDGCAVEWADGPIAGLGGPGWRFIDCDSAGNIEPGGAVPYRGREALEGLPQPFQKSKYAHAAVFSIMNA